MISEKTLIQYNNAIKELLDNTLKYLNNFTAIIDFFKSKSASMQRIIFPALKHHKDKFNLSDKEFDELKKHEKENYAIRFHQPITDEMIDKLNYYIGISPSTKERLTMIILIWTGARRMEVKKVVEGYLIARKPIFFILGKRNKQRKIYLSELVINELEEAIVTHGEEKLLSWFNPYSVYEITKKYFSLIGYEGACHDLRRRFAQNLDKQGTRISAVRSLMGHQSITTTNIYIKQTDEELKEIVEYQNCVNGPIDSKDYIKMIKRAQRLSDQLKKKQCVVQDLIQLQALKEKEIKKLKTEIKKLQNDKLKMKEKYRTKIKELKLEIE